MTSRVKILVTATALAAGMGLGSLAPGTLAHAAPTPSSADPCATPLPLSDSPPDLTTSTLAQGGYTLTLGQFGLHAQKQWLSLLHGALLPNDVVHTFEFTLPGAAHRYSGLVHTFGHGNTRHVCLDQRVWVDHGNGSYSEAHPHYAVMRLDGTIYGNQPYIHGRPGQTDTYMIGASATVSIQIGAHRYVLSGPTQTQWTM